MKQERLFAAIGGADEELLERSQRTRPEKRWRRGILAAAACLAAAISLALAVRWNRAAPPEEDLGANPVPPAAQVEFLGAEAGELRMVQIQYGPEAESDFVIYINTETYRAVQREGAYVVEPIRPLPQGVPPCRLTVTRREGVSPQAAADAAAAELKEMHSTVVGEGLSIYWQDGMNWNSPAGDLTFVDDRQGGTYVLAADYFLEAAEGHGARFADMAATFQVVTGDRVPAWMDQLEEAVADVSRAVFSGAPEQAGRWLAEDARIDACEEDVLADVSVASLDYTVDDGQTPSSAVVSVKHRLGGEDSFSYLTLELTYAGGQWRVHWGGMEK